MSDTKRDAAADLAVCAAATPGLNDVMPGSITDWDYANSTYTTEFMCNRRVSREQVQNDLRLFSIAGTALPHWIERATAAEAEVERLRALLLDGQTPDTCPICFGNGEVLHLKPDGTLTGHGGCKACYGTGSKQKGGAS